MATVRLFYVVSDKLNVDKICVTRKCSILRRTCCLVYFQYNIKWDVYFPYIFIGILKWEVHFPFSSIMSEAFQLNVQSEGIKYEN
jgi:hypothetical protein